MLVGIVMWPYVTVEQIFIIWFSSIDFICKFILVIFEFDVSKFIG